MKRVFASVRSIINLNIREYGLDGRVITTHLGLELSKYKPLFQKLAAQENFALTKSISTPYFDWAEDAHKIG